MIGKLARPKQIMFTPDLPKTRSGKIMRRLLRDIAEQRPLGDVTTLADANVVNTIREQSGHRRGLTPLVPSATVTTTLLTSPAFWTATVAPRPWPVSSVPNATA